MNKLAESHSLGAVIVLPVLTLPFPTSNRMNLANTLKFHHFLHGIFQF